MDRPSDRPPVPDRGQTMQLDALVGTLEEVPEGYGPPSLPPPLPPKKPAKVMYVVLGLVVILMAAAGVGVGLMVLGNQEPAEIELAAPVATPEPAEAEPAAEPADTEADEQAPGDDEGAGEAEVVHLDEVVF